MTKKQQTTPRIVPMAIDGCPGYVALSDGTIWSTDREVVKTRRDGSQYVSRLKGRMLRAHPAGAGYLYVTLGASRQNTGVHRLVCAAFHGPAPDGKPEAAHLDGCMTNNVPGNLAWVSRKENEAHKRAHGTHRQGKAHPWKPGQKKRGPAPTKHPEADRIRSMRAAGATIAQVADAFGLSKSGAHGILQRRI